MKKSFIISIVILLFSNIDLFGQVYYKVSCPLLNGDEGKEYVLDTVNFRAFLVSEDVVGWKVYKVDLLTGTSSQLNILANGPINAICYHNDSLYIGGTFTTVNSVANTYKFFAAYNLLSNNLLPGMNVQLDGEVSDITIHKNKLFIAGLFNNVLSTPRKRIVSLDYSTVPLVIDPVSFPPDLTNYINTNLFRITKMKSLGDHVFFLMDGTVLYGFTPYPPPMSLLTYQFSSGYDTLGTEVRLYDYNLIGSKMYVSGNIMFNSTAPDIVSLSNNPSYSTAPNFGYDKVTSYDIYSGAIDPSYDNLAQLFQPPTSIYSSEVADGMNFGCSGLSFYNNRFNLALARCDHPVAGRNSVVNTDFSISNFSNLYYSNISNPGGNAAYTPYHTINNVKSFSNIMTVITSHIDKHAGAYYQMANDNDSLIIMRTGNAAINGFSKTYGALCKGDTVTLKLKKQGSLHGHQWSYSGVGANFLMANSDSAIVVFNYGATVGKIKIYAFDNFNFVTDTFKFPVTFKPIPNVNAGANKTITCRDASVKLTATTSLTNYNIDWVTPTGFTTLDSLVPVTLTGTYYSRIKNNITGCYGYDTVIVNIDTIKPGIVFPSSNNYTLTCKQSSLLISANAINSLDTVYWTGKPKFISASTFTATAPGIFYVNCLGSVNGCKKVDSVKVFQNINPPPITNNVLSDSLTCTRDSVFLNGSSSSGNILFWRRPGYPANDSINDPIYTKIVGYHTLVVRDTSSGCKSTLLVNVKNSKLQPYVNVPSHTATITCSQSSIPLNGSSATPGATLAWLGPASFSSGNPANVSVTGTYTITATDIYNGCQKSDTVLVTRQNNLSLVSSNDTTICFGSSVTLMSLPNGGTPPYIYNWVGLGNSSQQAVNPLDSTLYVVTVTDNAGCFGKDSIKVNVPDIISDSVITFQPCDPNNPNGQVQVFTNGGTAPFNYSLNNGIYQSSNVFSNLSFGTYTVTTIDVNGCTKNSITEINNNSLAPSSDFIVSTHLFQTDTFVVVDISNPKPDSVQWIFPATFTVINISNPYAPVVICADTGYYNISQTAFFGGCQTFYNKQVHITYNDGSFANTYNNNGIQSLVLYPNPNNGQFNVDVTTYKKQTFALFINDAVGVEKLRIVVNDSDHYSGNIILPQVNAGTYVLKVVSAYDSKYVLFVVTQ